MRCAQGAATLEAFEPGRQQILCGRARHEPGCEAGCIVSYDMHTGFYDYCLLDCQVGMAIDMLYLARDFNM